MYAIYSKPLDEVYFAPSKEILDMFLNDRCRSHKDFMIKEIDDEKITDRDYCKIENNEIIEAYGCERAITADEVEFFNNIGIDEVYRMRKNLEYLIKTANKLQLSKKEKEFCDNVFERYYKFLSDVIEFEYDEDSCYDWMIKFCNMNALYDVIIKNWSGRVRKGG